MRFGAEFVTADVDRVDFSLATRSGSGSAARRVRGRTRSSSPPAPRRACSASTSEQRAARPRRLHVRDVRRVLLPRPRDRGRRRRRLRARGGELPHPLRRQGHARSTGARSCAASKIMQDRAFANPKIEFRWNSVVEDVKGDGRVEGVVLRDIETDATERARGHRRVRGDRPRPEHRSCSRGQLDLDDDGYIVTQARLDRRRRSRACSRAATCRTARTARRSPPPAPDAWPRSKPSATSRRSATARPPGSARVPRKDAHRG